MADHKQASDRTSERHIVSRRRLLKTSGPMVIAASLGGCSGLSGDGEQTASGGTTTGQAANGETASGGTSSGKPIDPRFDTVTNTEPINSHFNPYNPAQGSGLLSIIQNFLWKYNPRMDEWRPRISNGFSFDGNAATLSIDSSYKWQDGQTVTATDLVKQLQIDKGLGNPIWDYLSSVNAADDTTVDLEFNDTYNEQIIRSFLNRHVFVKRGSDWEQWVEKFNDASNNEKAMQQVEDNLRTWTYARDSGDPVSNGPFVVDSRSASQFVLTQNKHFPYKTNIEKFVFHSITSDQQMWQRAISDRLDGVGHFSVTESTLSKWPDHIKHYKTPIGECSCPVFNLNHSIWGKREARQALAYLLDRELLVENRNPRHSLLQQSSGMSDSTAELLMTERRRNQMNQYGTKSNPEKAAERMQAAGLQKQDGKWRTSDGTPASLEWMGATWPDSQGIAQTLRQLLPDFGIEFTGTIVSTPEWSTRRSQGKFGMTHAILSAGGTKPTSWLIYNAAVNNNVMNNQAGHPRKTVKLPPIGEPNGSLQTVNLQQMLQKMASTNDQTRLKELTAQAGWYINQFLPRLPATNTSLSATVSTDHWTFPSIDSDIMGMTNPHFQLLKETQGDSKTAMLQARTK